MVDNLNINYVKKYCDVCYLILSIIMDILIINYHHTQVQMILNITVANIL
jgi:hypothetical protein